MDGTLIDASTRNYSIYRENIVKLGGVPLEKEKYWQLKRKKTEITKILKLSKIPKKNHTLYNQRFIDQIESQDRLYMDTIFPFTSITLNQLHKLGHHLYLISYRKFKNRALKQLNKLGLANRFEKILIGRTNHLGQETKSQFISLILKNSKYPKTGKRGIFVGDNEDDILAAQKQKLVSIAVLSGIRNKSILRKCQPDLIIENIGQLPQLIDSVVDI